MKVTIAKRFTFDAAHHIDTLPEGHKCRRMHGHTYEVELRLHGGLDPRGFVADYQEIADAWASAVHEKLDHRLLNDVPGLSVPSTEWLVAVVFHWLMDTPIAELLSSVRISESSTTWAEMSAREYAASAHDIDLRIHYEATHK